MDSTATRDPRTVKLQSTSVELDLLSKEELIKKVIQLQSHVTQLKNVLAKRETGETKTIKSKPFEFSKYKRRHVALKFLYLGWDYKGYVIQEDTVETIEHHLFDALIRTKLIEDRETSNYHRCGRTDKGVSAFSQVISIDLRSALGEGIGVFAPDNYDGNNSKFQDEEIRYCLIINRLLPPEIRCISWSPVKEGFSARFDCCRRTYKYYFPRGCLDINRMNKAAQQLVGSHDFRNLCKMDVKNGVTNYRREIYDVTLLPISSECESPYTIYELTVVGRAFLWHQIRCIVGILLLIGDEKNGEDPSIVSHLLNINEVPNKPQYQLASEIPLVLFSVDFGEEHNVKWELDSESIEHLISHLQGLWTLQTVKAQVIRSMLSGIAELGNNFSEMKFQQKPLSQEFQLKIYKPLFDRPCAVSLEERLQQIKRPKTS